MTAQTVPQQSSLPDPIRDARDPVGAAREHIASRALQPSPGDRVGLELEFHLVDLARPEVRPDWQRVLEVLADVTARGSLPAASSLTVEPGGQLELSSPPVAGAGPAIRALRADVARLRAIVAESGLGLAALGTDPARRPSRINPKPRYAAMERHFDVRGEGRAGRAMMSSTAALQVNLDAGPRAGWRDRLALIHALIPVLVTLSSTSPWLGGRASSWHCERDRVWRGVDRARSGPVGPVRSGSGQSGSGRVGSEEPGEALADYALDAPLMMIHRGEECLPLTNGLTLGSWLADRRQIGWAAGVEDVDHHLTTLFPPVRPRGYVELRVLDALPDQWWPGVVAFVVTLVDDPVAADRARDLVGQLEGLSEEAARLGLAQPTVRRALTNLLRVAHERCPDDVRPDLEPLADLVDRGRTPADQLRERIERSGPLRVLEEEAHA